MGILIEEEILITDYQRWLMHKLKEPSRSRRVSSLAPRSYRPRKLQPALDSTKKLDSDSKLPRKRPKVNTSTRSAHSPETSASVEESSRVSCFQLRCTELLSFAAITSITSRSTTDSRSATRPSPSTAPHASVSEPVML